MRLSTPLEGPEARQRAEARLLELGGLLADPLNRISAPRGYPSIEESAFHFSPE